jgi:hypothetical protein
LIVLDVMRRIYFIIFDKVLAGSGIILNPFSESKSIIDVTNQAAVRTILLI